MRWNPEPGTTARAAALTVALFNTALVVFAFSGPARLHDLLHETALTSPVWLWRSALVWVGIVVAGAAAQRKSAASAYHVLALLHAIEAVADGLHRLVAPDLTPVARWVFVVMPVLDVLLARYFHACAVSWKSTPESGGLTGKRRDAGESLSWSDRLARRLQHRWLGETAGSDHGKARPTDRPE